MASAMDVVDALGAGAGEGRARVRERWYFMNRKPNGTGTSDVLQLSIPKSAVSGPSFHEGYLSIHVQIRTLYLDDMWIKDDRVKGSRPLGGLWRRDDTDLRELISGSPGGVSRTSRNSQFVMETSEDETLPRRVRRPPALENLFYDDTSETRLSHPGILKDAGELLYGIYNLKPSVETRDGNERYRLDIPWSVFETLLAKNDKTRKVYENTRQLAEQTVSAGTSIEDMRKASFGLVSIFILDTPDPGKPKMESSGVAASRPGKASLVLVSPNVTGNRDEYDYLKRNRTRILRKAECGPFRFKDAGGREYSLHDVRAEYLPYPTVGGVEKPFSSLVNLVNQYGIGLTGMVETLNIGTLVYKDFYAFYRIAKRNNARASVAQIWEMWHDEEYVGNLGSETEIVDFYTSLFMRSHGESSLAAEDLMQDPDYSWDFEAIDAAMEMVNERINANDLPSMTLTDVQTVLEDECSGLISLVSLKDANEGDPTKAHLLVADNIFLSWHVNEEVPLLKSFGRAFVGDAPFSTANPDRQKGGGRSSRKQADPRRIGQAGAR